jgi:hypothetical protein
VHTDHELCLITLNGLKVVSQRQAVTMESPSQGVYVYDFEQNGPGWCKVSMTAQVGAVVQLRHAEVLQHPPYGPEDGNIYVDNLRSAKATDIYVFKGDPDGETVEFSFTQHGFRYVEVTFPTSMDPAGQPLVRCLIADILVLCACCMALGTWVRGCLMRGCLMLDAWCMGAWGCVNV